MVLGRGPCRRGEGEEGERKEGEEGGEEGEEKVGRRRGGEMGERERRADRHIQCQEGQICVSIATSIHA